MFQHENYDISDRNARTFLHQILLTRILIKNELIS